VLSRLSANALLKAVVAAMAVVVVVLLGISSWGAWQRLQSAGRIVQVADASSFAFKAMHNLRTDRSTTVRSVKGDDVVAQDVADRLKGIREDEVPALKSAVAALADIDFPDRDTLYPTFTQTVDTIFKLQAESWEAMHKPEAERREGTSQADGAHLFQGAAGIWGGKPQAEGRAPRGPGGRLSDPGDRADRHP